jgi:hypothetical protein
MDNTMAISLPQYKQQVQPVADTTALKRDPNLEAKRIQAEAAADVSKLDTFANVAKVGAQLAFQYRDTHNQAEKANYSIEQQAMLEAYKDEISIINDEDELARAKEKYLTQVESVKNKYIDNIYGNKAKRQIDVLDAEFKGKLDLLDTNRAFTIETDRLANTQFEYRAAAENGILLDNPNTGQKFQPVFKQEVDFKSGDFIDVLDESGQPIIEKTALQVQDEYATNELLRLGKITSQSAADRKIRFGQNVEYKKLKLTLETDIENFDKIYDPTKLSTELNIQIKTLKAQYENRLNTKIVNTQSKVSSNLLERAEEGTVTTEEVENIFKQKEIIFGKEISVISEEQKNTINSLILSRTLDAQSINATEYVSINKLISGLVEKGAVQEDDLKQIYKKMYKIEGGLPKALFPAQQIQAWFKIIGGVVEKSDEINVSKPLAVNPTVEINTEQKELLIDILNVTNQALQLDELVLNPVQKLEGKNVLGRGIQRTITIQNAFSRMMLGKTDELLGKVLTPEQFKENYLKPLKKDNAKKMAYGNGAIGDLDIQSGFIDGIKIVGINKETQEIVLENGEVRSY